MPVRVRFCYYDVETTFEVSKYLVGTDTVASWRTHLVCGVLCTSARFPLQDCDFGPEKPHRANFSSQRQGSARHHAKAAKGVLFGRDGNGACQQRDNSSSSLLPHTTRSRQRELAPTYTGPCQYLWTITGFKNIFSSVDSILETDFSTHTPQLAKHLYD